MPGDGTALSPEAIEHIRRVFAECGGNISETCRRTGNGPRTVRRYAVGTVAPSDRQPAAFGEPRVAGYAHDLAGQVAAAMGPAPRLPDPAPEAGGPTLPEAVDQQYEPFRIDTAGTWLVLGDCHFPFHDKKTIELAVAEARRRMVAGVLLNGDILDCAEVSEHERDPDSLDLADEIQIGKQFLSWLRWQLPAARLVYKEGNHDARVPRFILKHAPALFALAGVGLPSWLELANIGAEWVPDKRVVAMGKLNVIHGHEYRGGAGSGVNPARGLYLKARSVAMCGHHHRTSEHHARNIRDQYEAAWSVGCACYLHPRWLPLNDWNLGFAFVSLEADGNFIVENKRVLNGKVV